MRVLVILLISSFPFHKLATHCNVKSCLVLFLVSLTYNTMFNHNMILFKIPNSFWKRVRSLFFFFITAQWLFLPGKINLIPLQPHRSPHTHSQGFFSGVSYIYLFFHFTVSELLPLHPLVLPLGMSWRSRSLAVTNVQCLLTSQSYRFMLSTWIRNSKCYLNHCNFNRMLKINNNILLISEGWMNHILNLRKNEN